MAAIIDVKHARNTRAICKCSAARVALIHSALTGMTDLILSNNKCAVGKLYTVSNRVPPSQPAAMVMLQFASITGRI